LQRILFSCVNSPHCKPVAQAGAGPVVLHNANLRGQSTLQRDQMTSDTGAIRFVSLAMLITDTGLLFLNYISS